jgi:hypothetical protein
VKARKERKTGGRAPTVHGVRADSRPGEGGNTMTSISSVSTTSTSATTSTHHHRGKDPMAAVATKLGLSSDDLKTQLKSGKSLDDIATAQGVSHDDLIAAIKSGMPADKASGADADAMAEKIASTKGMPKPPPGGGPKGANSGIQDSSKLDGVSKLLDMDSDDVSSQATSATDLVKMLQNKGVDLNQLKSVLNSGDLMDVSA